MVRISFLTFSFCCLMVSPAIPEDCLVCDSEIVMTPAFAECFLRQVDGLISEMQMQKLPYQLVNLGTCDGITGAGRGPASVADSARQVFSLAEIRNATPATLAQPTTTFILDEAGLRCLADAINADLANFDPAAAFRPGQMCVR
jgi:hypothetical protein